MLLLLHYVIKVDYSKATHMSRQGVSNKAMRKHYYLIINAS